MSKRSGLDFASVIAGLPVPIAKFGGLAFSASTTPNIAPARLGKSTEGDPAFLFPSSERATQRPPIELRHLSVLFGAPCHVSGEVEEDAYFTVVRCRGDDALQKYFLLMAGTLLSALGPGATEAAVEKSVLAFVELFRAAGRPPTYALRGLWGELLLVARSSDAITALRAWHVAADERFDFGAGRQRVEVKTSGRGSRRHHFSLEQLTAADLEVCVASIQIEPSAAGRTLLELVDGITTRLTHIDDTIRLATTVGLVLGTDWSEYSNARFDDALAAASLRFYPAEIVARVTLPVPDAVTQVQFVSDVAECDPMPIDQLQVAGGLWAAIRPQGVAKG